MEHMRRLRVLVFTLGIGAAVIVGFSDSSAIVLAGSSNPVVFVPQPQSACYEPATRPDIFCEITPYAPRCRSKARTPVLPDVPAPSQPVLTPVPVKRSAVYMAPMPIAYVVKDGRLMCGVAHDEPHKSRKNKKTHMDMECCLDPDEIPNPYCYYSEVEYGKYLKKFR
jgi:hypothetical protein